MIKRCLFYLMTTSVLSISYSFGFQQETCESGIAILIDSIQIEGNYRTRNSVILNELGLSQDHGFCPEQIAMGLDRVKSLGLFSSVSLQQLPGAGGRTKLILSVEEKWTTIPILKINSGGGVTQYTLGVYDPNTFGSFKETGIQYENLAGTSSGVLWFKNPRLFDDRQGIDLQYWNIRRIRTKYNPNSENAEIVKGFLQKREKAYVEYFREFAKDSLWKVSVDFNDDSFSKENLPQDVKDKIEDGPPIPQPTKYLLTNFGVEFGKIKGDVHLLEGQVVGMKVGYASPLQGHLHSFVLSDLSFVYHKPLNQKAQIAQRVLVGGTTTEVLQYWYYIGGLDRIRGFSDNRFAGRFFSLSNTEVRYLVTQSPNVVFQSLGFLDLLGMGENGSEIFNLKAASVGLGMRLILPKFYRFVLRFDYAKPVVKSDPMNWSIGVQQFF